MLGFNNYLVIFMFSTIWIFLSSSKCDFDIKGIPKSSEVRKELEKIVSLLDSLMEKNVRVMNHEAKGTIVALRQELDKIVGNVDILMEKEHHRITILINSLNILLKSNISTLEKSTINVIDLAREEAKIITFSIVSSTVFVLDRFTENIIIMCAIIGIIVIPIVSIKHIANHKQYLYFSLVVCFSLIGFCVVLLIPKARANMFGKKVICLAGDRQCVDRNRGKVCVANIQWDYFECNKKELCKSRECKSIDCETDKDCMTLLKSRYNGHVCKLNKCVYQRCNTDGDCHKTKAETVCEKGECKIPTCISAGERCCYGNKCKRNRLICISDHCANCGNLNQPCCVYDGISCYESNSLCQNSWCMRCGNEGEPCCSNSKCNSKLTCMNDKCIQCGNINMPCCKNAMCDHGYTCENERCLPPVQTIEINGQKRSGTKETGGKAGNIRLEVRCPFNYPKLVRCEFRARGNVGHGNDPFNQPTDENDWARKEENLGAGYCLCRGYHTHKTFFGPGHWIICDVKAVCANR